MNDFVTETLRVAVDKQVTMVTRTQRQAEAARAHGLEVR